MTSPEELNNNYNNTEKCKISWKIENIVKSSYDNCVYKLEITLKENNNYYKVISSELKNSDWSDFCIVDTTFPFYKTWNISYYPKVWDDFKWIIKKSDKDYPVLSYWEEIYNNFTWSECESNYSWWIISTNDNFPKELLDKNNTWVISVFNTWSDIKNTELTQKENTISLKKDNQKTQTTQKITTTKSWNILKTTSNTGNIIKFAWNEISKNTNSWSLENSLNIINLSWSNLTQNYNSWKLVQSWSLENSWANFSNSGTITQEPEKIPENNSNYYLFWSLILTFIIIWVLVFKLLKIKK